MPYLLEICELPGGQNGESRAARSGWLARVLERFAWRSANRLLVATSVLGRAITEAGTDPARIAMVPNGVALDRFLPPPFAPDDLAATGAPSGLVLGCVASGCASAGIEEVIGGIAAQDAACPDMAPMRLTVIFARGWSGLARRQD